MKILLFILSIFLLPQSAWAGHAFAQYGNPKYPKDFAYFDFVNPQAPQGGTITLANPDRRTSFDKFNPYTLRGVSAPGIAGLLFESLAIGSADETSTIYGLIADDMTLSSDHLSMTFHLRPEAKFSDGSPILGSDVKYSFDTLMSKAAHPSYRNVFADIKQVVVLSDRLVRFDFKSRTGEAPLLAGTMPIFSSKWGLKPDGTRTPFDQLAFEKPIGSGPYIIESYQTGRNIVFKKNPQYWGKNLNVRVGNYNFDRIVYKLFSDDTVRLEAFKAGEFDAIVEYRAKLWAKSYVGRKFNSGSLVKKEFVHHNGAGMQGFAMNTRKEIFNDPKVRQALGLALDFEWLNRQIFYSQYKRLDSYFSNSLLGATNQPNSVPTGEELELLKKLQQKYPGEIPSSVFGPMPSAASTAAPSSLRSNLLKAKELLAQAGWTYRDGALRNQAGKPFEFEMLEDSPFLLRILTAYVRNLEKLGIKANVRTTDNALYQQRLNEHDFEMTTIRYQDSQSPGNELWDRFGSEAATQKGTDNQIGVRLKSVDELIALITRAEDRDKLYIATRALDRIMIHNYFVVPHWYNPTHRIAYNTQLGYPDPPDYYTAEGWILGNWWRNPSSTEQKE
jgi:microcin C transport system substrate-binding protein